MSETARRALVIAYDFPPHGAIGTMRTLRLVRHLHEEGWQVSVLTGALATYLPGTPVEPALEAQVPAGVQVMQVRAVRPFSAFEGMLRRVRPRVEASDSAPGPRDGTGRSGTRTGWKSRVRAARDLVETALDIPDKESGWVAPAIARGVRYMASAGRPDVIYSSAPPWSGQAVALALARFSRRPWVADFRDPWARAPWREWRRAFRQRAASLLERRVVGRADAVLFVTEANRAEFAAVYGTAAAGRFQLVPNGCDPAELQSLPLLPSRDEFVLLHAGTFYGARSPMPVIEAVARAVNRGALDRRRFRLRLLGNISVSVDVPAECARLGIPEVVEFVPRVTRAESLREMKSASALLLVQIGTTVSVPGKAYEYLAAGRPILSLSEEGETSSLVRASGIGVSVRPDAPPEDLEAALLQVVALAGRPFLAAPPELYDGRVHAETAARTLSHFARHGRRATVAFSPAVPVVQAATRPEESHR
jgi:glycosyltransferase involved in cell wall biosynthesis